MDENFNSWREIYKQTDILQALLIIAVFYTLYFAKLVILPILVALLLNYLLSPLVRVLKRIYIPAAFSVPIIIFGLIFLVGFLFYHLTDPAKEWIRKSPQFIAEINTKIQSSNNPIREFFTMTKQVKKQWEELAIAASPESKVVEVKSGDFYGSLLNQTTAVAFEVVVCVVLLYFLLIYQDFILAKLVPFMSGLKGKKDIVRISRETEFEISLYLGIQVLINFCLGIVISIEMYFLGMPNPFLWGILAGLLEFIPYLGVIIGTVIIGFMALVTFDNVWYSLMIPLVYYLTCSISGNFVAPFVLGRAFTMNPIMVFLGVVFWGWMWGVVGALIAVPIMVSIKVIYNNLYSDSLVSEFLRK